MGYKRGRGQRLFRTVGSLAIASALIALAAPAHASEATWVGLPPGSWVVNSNWSPDNGFPNSPTANVFIDGDPFRNSVVFLDGTAAVGTLSIGAGDTLNIGSGGLLGLNGNVTLNGELKLGSTTAISATLFAQTNLTLGGSGTLTLGNGGVNQIRSFVHSVTGPQRITFLEPLTIQGAGDLGLGQAKFTNQAIVEANQSTPLVIRPALPFADTFINQNTLRATNGASLQLMEATYTNAGGKIEAWDKSTVNLLPGVNIVGGTASSKGTGQIWITGAVTLENVTLAEGVLNVFPGSRLDLKSTLTNKGTIYLGNSGSSLADLQYIGDTTIAGNGAIVMKDGANSRIYGKVDNTLGVGRLTIGVGQTIRGTGIIGANQQAMITNEGTIIADQATPLTIAVKGGTDVINRGSIKVNNGSTLTVSPGANLVQDAANASVEVDGRLIAAAFILQAGGYSGMGTFEGTLVSTGGIVSPGKSPGTLSIVGSYTQGENASLLMELDGTGQGTGYDLLQVTGNAALDGTLDLRFGFTPAVGASFVILTTGSGNVSGEFDSILKPAGWVITTAYNTKNVTLTIAAVPEPESYAFMLTGLGLIAWAVKRRQRRMHASWPART